MGLSFEVQTSVLESVLLLLEGILLAALKLESSNNYTQLEGAYIIFWLS